MNYITTNIRLSEEDYLRLKEEAAKKRTSLAAVIREKISDKKARQRSSQKIFKTIRNHAEENSHYLKGVDIVEVLRQMRNHPKW